MALGALKNSRADIAVSITGIAGPAGGSPDPTGRTGGFRPGAQGAAVRLVEKRFPMRGRERYQVRGDGFRLVAPARGGGAEPTA